MMLARRGLLAGLGLLAAPAIIRTPGLLMPVRAWLNGGIPPGGGQLLLSATERYADGMPLLAMRHPTATDPASSPQIVWVPLDGSTITYELSINWGGTWQPHPNQEGI